MTTPYTSLALQGDTPGYGLIFPDVPGCCVERPVARSFEALKAAASKEDWWALEGKVVALVTPRFVAEAAE